MKKNFILITISNIYSFNSLLPGLLIKPKQILDVRSGKLINADILIESGVIVKVAKNIPIKSEYEIIDLRDMTFFRLDGCSCSSNWKYGSKRS